MHLSAVNLATPFFAVIIVPSVMLTFVAVHDFNSVYLFKLPYIINTSETEYDELFDTVKV